MKKIIWVLILAFIFYCCNHNKTKTTTQQPPSKNVRDTIPQVDSFGLTQFNTMKRVLPENEQLQLRAAKGKPIKPVKPPITTTTTGVLLLQFNGGIVKNTSWNINGDITLDSSGLTLTQQKEILDSCVSKYSQFNINVTTDQSIYNAAPITKRSECFITETYQWYGSGAGDVSFVGSFAWGDNTPCFVFSMLLNYNTKFILEAVPHELGHTLSLYHAAKYDTLCILTSQYDYGNNGIAPIMGVAYFQQLSLFGKFPTPFGCNDMADEVAIIKSQL
jgi:hypothetical protein